MSVQTTELLLPWIALDKFSTKVHVKNCLPHPYAGPWGVEKDETSKVLSNAIYDVCGGDTWIHLSVCFLPTGCYKLIIKHSTTMPTLTAVLVQHM